MSAAPIPKASQPDRQQAQAWIHTMGLDLVDIHDASLGMSASWYTQCGKSELRTSSSSLSSRIEPTAMFTMIEGRWLDD